MIESVHTLMRELDRQDDLAQLSALAKLKQFGRGAEDTIPKLLEMMCNSNTLIIRACAELLGHVGNASENVVSSLKGGLKNPDTKLACACALVRLGNDDGIVIIENELREGSWDRKLAAIYIVGQFDPFRLKSFESLLKGLLKDPDMRVRSWAGLVLESFADPSLEKS